MTRSASPARSSEPASTSSMPLLAGAPCPGHLIQACLPSRPVALKAPAVYIGGNLDTTEDWVSREFAHPPPPKREWSEGMEEGSSPLY